MGGARQANAGEQKSDGGKGALGGAGGIGKIKSAHRSAHVARDGNVMGHEQRQGGPIKVVGKATARKLKAAVSTGEMAANPFAAQAYRDREEAPSRHNINSKTANSARAE